MTTAQHAPHHTTRGRAGARRLRAGLLGATGLFVVAALAGHYPGVDVHAGSVAPLMADWRPRIGIGTVPALVIALWCASGRAHTVAQQASWRALLVGTWALGLLWMLSLALVDGTAGIGAVLDHGTEYLQTARAVDDVGGLLRTFTSRVPLHSAGNWPVHVAGHPPGALLFFVALVRLGLGSGLAAGLVVCLVAATTPVAVAVALRALGAEDRLRIALPFLVIGPFAIWQAVSGDAVFAAVGAWAVALAALAAAGAGPARAAWALGAGVLLGLGGLASYGLPLISLVVLAAVTSVVRGSAAVLRLLAGVGATAVAVVLVPALWGFRYWEAYPVLRERYWDGLASARPTGYWLWADLAVLVAAAGPLLFGALALAGPDLMAAVRSPRRDVVATLVVGAAAIIAIADLSLMSKAEVERIWLPFLPWLLLATAFLPPAWRRRALVGQVALALLLQHLLVFPW